MSSDSVAERFQPFSLAIRVASDTLKSLDLRVRPQGDAKATLVAMLRARLPEAALPWVDAALVLSGGRLRFPQLLGTGGNDGRLDFTNNLMRRLRFGGQVTGDLPRIVRRTVPRRQGPAGKRAVGHADPCTHNRCGGTILAGRGGRTELDHRV